MTEYYAGIGSRETPAPILEQMEGLGRYFSGMYTLRSGAADGADMAFETGCNAGSLAGPGEKQIFLPWPGFNRRSHTNPNERPKLFYGVGPNALAMASQFHPAWGRCSQGAQKLHARNCYQVLGPKLDTPCSFIVCWTRDGGLTGGTAQAMRIAIHHRIPIYNLFHADAYSNLMKDWG